MVSTQPIGVIMERSGTNPAGVTGKGNPKLDCPFLFGRFSHLNLPIE